MTMPYPLPASINGIDPNLFPFKVASDVVFKQYWKKIPWSNIMGMESNRPIVTRTVKAGDGFNYRVPKLNAIDHSNPVTDYNQIRGQAQTPTTVYDTVNLGQKAFPCIIENARLTSFGTPIDLRNYIVSEITDACALCLNDDLLNAATTYVPAASQPSYDRVITAGYYPTRATYNANANLNTTLAAMVAGVSSAQNGLSALSLMQASNMASIGGNRNGAVLFQNRVIEDQIRPAKLETRDGWATNKYLAFFDPQALFSLMQDPLFQATTTARGTVTSSTQPEMISGADYVGEFQGVYIYKVDDLSRYQLTVAGHTYSWGFLIGAAAWSLGWAEHASIASDKDEIERSILWTSHETRGQKVIAFPAKQASTTVPVEQGLIHIFTQIS